MQRQIGLQSQSHYLKWWAELDGVEELRAVIHQYKTKLDKKKKKKREVLLPMAKTGPSTANSVNKLLLS